MVDQAITGALARPEGDCRRGRKEEEPRIASQSRRQQEETPGERRPEPGGRPKPFAEPNRRAGENDDPERKGTLQMTRPLRLKEMTPARAIEVFMQVPRLLIPAGTLEGRGPHLPLGCDSVILEHLADDLSATTGIVRAPTMEFGVHASADETTAGSAALTRKTLHRAVNELIAVWEEVAGVRDTLILTAHAADPHLEALSTIRTIGRVRVVDILALESLLSIREVRSGPWHGGEIDTSLMLFLAPDLVETSRVPAGVPATADKGSRFYQAIKQTLLSHLGDLAKS